MTGPASALTLFAHATGKVHERGFLHRPDGRIYYEVTGEGPAIVFAHIDSTSQSQGPSG